MAHQVDSQSDPSTLAEPVAEGPVGSVEPVMLAIWPSGRGHVFPLPRSGSVTIGRGKGCEIRLTEPGVSRAHAILHVGPRLSIEDLGSANGTRHRGEPIPPNTPRVIRLGDTFEVAGILLTVQCRRRNGVEAPGEPGAIQPAPAMAEVMMLAERVARGTISVLLLGETGVGKDVMARHVHLASPRASRPFLRLNCPAFSESLIESELFGHERGAFTGATGEKPGLVETADGGTIFLDEVGDLPLSTQVKLLRVIEQREFFRIGSVQPRSVDVRFIAATNRDIEAEVARGTFRQDLFFRLAGAVLRVPPLRQRRQEILPFARHFLAEAARGMAIPAPSLSPDAAAWLESYEWPGNLRELRNCMERAALLCGSGPVRLEHVRIDSRPEAAPAMDERERLVAALAQFGGNQTHAARFLGISRNTLIARIERYRLTRPRKS